MEDESNAIEVRNVMKDFRISGRERTLKSYVMYRKELKNVRRTVLEDITFDVKKGSVLGIIGRNGSGKSTMLKLLTGILNPNSGTIEKKGRVASLIELGAGFHPDMTGRENIYTNASIFGQKKKDVDTKMQQIIDFSELSEFIDERVRNYSSGMYLRLAFSVAINIEADILLVDEILAVGDMKFQRKCLRKLQEMRDNGLTIVIVTHTIDIVRTMCDDAIWLDDRHIRMHGDPNEVCDAYEEAMSD